MAKLLMATALCAAVFSQHVPRASADEAPSQDVTREAERAQVNPVDLLGALHAEADAGRLIEPCRYLFANGEIESCPDLGLGLIAPLPPLLGAIARADCIIQKESGTRDVPNAQGSGALGFGQFFPGTWATDTAMYRKATGYLGPLSLHVLADVRRVIAWILDAHPLVRSQWTVAGCN